MSPPQVDAEGEEGMERNKAGADGEKVNYK